MKLVILDRDGTINEDRDDYVKSADEWVPMPGALEAIARLNHAGWHTVVATNQSGLARGLFAIDQLPTGDKDPFALRRHALGVLRILTERLPALSLDRAGRQRTADPCLSLIHI